MCTSPVGVERASTRRFTGHARGLGEFDRTGGRREQRPYTRRRCPGETEGFSVGRPEEAARVYARRMFAVAWAFLAVTALLGCFLRWQPFVQLPGISYGNLLHTHSHIAFLGWVYNAFFALAMRFFIPAEKARALWRLFLAVQPAVLGILVTFPFQGYGRESTVFSTLHLVLGVSFIVSLLRNNEAVAAARPWLWASAIFLFASSLGPLSLGPLAVAGVGEPWKSLAIGYYLHFQYNGWFIFYLVAVVFQVMATRGLSGGETMPRRAFFWLFAGCVLTLPLSALPAGVPLWVYGVVGAGGLVQLVGTVYLVRAVRNAGLLFEERGRLVGLIAAGAFGLLGVKMLLQALAAFPSLTPLATNRFTIIAFMHLVFLGVVTPLLIAWAVRERWLSLSGAGVAGLGMMAVGAVTSQMALAYVPIAAAMEWPQWPGFLETQAASAVAVFCGVFVLGIAAPRNRRCFQRISMASP